MSRDDLEKDTLPYDIAVVRNLLRDAFTAKGLRRLCQDRLTLRPLLGHFREDSSLEDMIDVVIVRCEKGMLLDELLAAVKEANPKQYERYHDQLYEIHDLDAAMEGLRARRDEADRRRREMRDRQRVVNLRPLDVSHTFKDRLRETQALCQHLADSRVRLVSVVGRGGMGKTALVSRVLADLEHGILPMPGEERALSVDGILYLSARSTGLGLERIYTDVGRMLGEPVTSQLAARWITAGTSLAEKVEYLLEAMHSGMYLILLDNLEDHLTASGDIADEGLRLFVERCLTQPSGAQLIATSREQVKIVPAALPGVRSLPLREGLPAGEAMAMLRELDPQDELGLQSAPDDILHRAVVLCEGIPRALELLAGIMLEDPTSSLPDLLADEHLFGKQVVERLVAEGYRRLGEGERRVMEALAIFDRPVEETAIAYLLHPWFSDVRVRRALRRLARSYFVSTNRITSAYSLHPLDREYIYGRLPDGDEPGAYHKRNLELRAAAFYASIRKPESEWKTIEDLTPQLSEFEHLVRAKEYGGACELLEPVDYRYLYLWGHYTRLVEMRQRLVAHLKDPGMQIDNLGSLGRANRALGQFDRALARFRQAIDIAREIGDREREGIQFGHLGGVYRALGQIEQSAESYEQALAIAREIGDRRVECMHLGHVGMSYRARGELDRGIEFHREALAIARELDDQELQGANLASLGSGYRALGQIEQSIRFFEQSLAIAREIGDRRVEGFDLASLGRACRTLGRIEQAIEYYEQALSIARQTGYRQGEAADLGDLGDAYSGLGQTERAVEYHQQALAIARDIGDRRQQSWELIRLGRISLTMRHFSDAKDYLEEAVALDVTESAYMAALLLGILHLIWRGPEAGRDTFSDLVRRCEDLLGKTKGLYRVRYTLATALVAAAVCNPQWENESKRAELLAPSMVEYGRALEICATTGIVQDALRDLELIRVGGTEGLEPVFELLENALETGYQARI